MHEPIASTQALACLMFWLTLPVFLLLDGWLLAVWMGWYRP